MKKYYKYFELCVWISGLVVLACFNPTSEGLSLCIFKLIGFESCPGCGLGHSISWIFHGNLHNSVEAHPLGLFALLIILTRIYTLVHSLIIFSFKPKL